MPPVDNLSRPRRIGPRGAFDTLVRNPWAWVLAALVSLGRVDRLQGIDPALFFGAAFLFVTLPGVLWSYPAWSNRNLPETALVVGGGFFVWPYPWLYHDSRRGLRPIERTYKHRVPRARIRPGVPVAQVRLQALWAGGRGPLRRIEPAEMAVPDGELESRVHQVSVGDGRTAWAVCKGTDPTMRLVPFIRALAGGAPPGPMVVARAAGGPVHAGP